MESISTIVNFIRNNANKQIGNALIVRADVINSMFDDAYGSCLGGHYASGMECATEGLRQLDDLLEYADNVKNIADGPAWEYVRDALGSVRVEKAPLQQEIVNEYKRRIKRYVSPKFGDVDGDINIQVEQHSPFIKNDLAAELGRICNAVVRATNT